MVALRRQGRRPAEGVMAGRGSRRYDRPMIARINLADPAYEPSDEDLRDAFSGLAGAREESLTAMRARIERLQAEARARFDASRLASGRT